MISVHMSDDPAFRLLNSLLSRGPSLCPTPIKFYIFKKLLLKTFFFFLPLFDFDDLVEDFVGEYRA